MKLPSLKYFVILVGLSVNLLTGGCDEVKNDPNDDSAAFLSAREAYDDEYFEMALPKLQEFTARFPYSKFSKEAKLLIADSHFQLDQFPEAAAVYDQFVKLNPSHPKADFALYRVGLCYWEEAPEELDREQEFTQKSIGVWQELKTRYPASKYLKEANASIEIGQRRLAEAEHFVAKFYCKQKLWGACAFRAVSLIENHAKYQDLLKKGAKLGERAFGKMAEKREKGTLKEDANLFTKNMTVAQLKAKSLEFGQIAAKFK